MTKKGSDKKIFPKGVLLMSENDVELLAEILLKRVPAEYTDTITLIVIKTLIIENIVFFNELIINNNVTIGSSLYKKVWTQVLALFRGSTIEQVKGIAYSAKNKIPSKLRSLNVFFLLVKSKGVIPEFLHILESVYVTYKRPTELPELDLDSVTRKMTPSAYQFSNEFSPKFRSFLRAHPVINDTRSRWDKNLGSLSRQFKLTNKAGPNGKATKTMLDDAYVLKHSTKLFKIYTEMCTHLNCQYLVSAVEHYSSIYERSLPKDAKPNLKVGKLTQVPEKGNKNRVVAISNFWLQQCMNLLRQLIDVTFTKTFVKNNACFMYCHEGSLAKAFESYSNTGYSISFDLSNASDRIPRIYQRDILSTYVNPRFGQTYFDMVSNIDFETKDGQIINYEVGQPMGSYESFNLFQLFLMEL